ncbi:hypothetical protein GGTG_09091 [Gaeumannomyces tritici R3-111a-1]|uniref:Uncharacterized protein n=1 Tax=Gaeumannomyces tritici (strain R3-111a-1) TaxID=644352 RepID=J3P6F1_GAET3|nr:hypothetical protein GGTG_09091 [Gaeumannomyces tritici R3-111a-1]EJT72225.1 hypothetical protein GGTG_09091 [Gaeumannomyces tritici R3-111a-1]
MLASNVNEAMACRLGPYVRMPPGLQDFFSRKLLLLAGVDQPCDGPSGGGSHRPKTPQLLGKGHQKEDFLSQNVADVTPADRPKDWQKQLAAQPGPRYEISASSQAPAGMIRRTQVEAIAHRFSNQPVGLEVSPMGLRIPVTLGPAMQLAQTGALGEIYAPANGGEQEDSCAWRELLIR